MSSGHGGSPLPGLDKINEWVHNAHENSGTHLKTAPLVIAFVVLVGVFFFIDPMQTIYNFEFLLFFSPLWIPIILFPSALNKYIAFIRYNAFTQREWVLLEFRIPRDTLKTPLAMETFIANMHIGSGETNWYKKYVGGGTRPSFSFELVSIEGRVHFYMWTTQGYRRLAEAYLYAQYPEVEVIEVEDYSRVVDPASHDWSMWGIEFGKKGPNPIPIKTYMEYNLTPGAKAEENVDPLAQLVEYLGTLGPGEQFWIQYNFRMHKSETYEPRKNAGGGSFTWRDDAAEQIESLRQKSVLKVKNTNPTTHLEEENIAGGPTEGQKNAISAIERNVAKPGFDVGIRVIYCAPESKFQGINIPAMLNMYKPFNNESNNGLVPQGVWGGIFGDYPWEDPGGHHAEHLNHELLNYYRQRIFFYPPYRGNWSVFSSEEFATLFHIPSSMITTPNLPRIQSATSSAPSNLPT